MPRTPPGRGRGNGKGKSRNRDDGPGATLRSPEADVGFMLAALVVVGVIAALTSRAAPTGLEVPDGVWVAGFTVVVAYFAGYGRRWTWFLPAGAGALLAADAVTLAVAGAAVLLAMASVWFDVRSRAFAALVVGLGMAALLNTESLGFHGANSILTGVVVLPVIVSGYRLASRTVRRFMKKVGLWASGLVALSLAGAVLGVVLVAEDLTQGARLVDQGISAAQDADSSTAQDRMGEASRHMHSAEATLTSWFVQPAHGLPVVGPNLRAVSEMARDTAEATTASQVAAATADLENLRFEDGRLDPRRIEAMEQPLRNVADSASSARNTIDSVESPWLVEPLQSRLYEISEEVNTNLPDLEQALAAVEVAPSLIGGDGDRRYLVLFTTPAEARGRTGFPGNYAELTFVDGQLDMPVFGRIRDLEDGGEPLSRVITDQDEYMGRYGRFDPQTTWRNVPMSPDFPTVAEVAMQLYPQSGTDREVDGVLSVDPTGLAALMHFTGPVEVEGRDEPLTAENVEQFLYVEQYIAYEEVNDERTDFLGDVAEAVFSDLTRISLPAPEEVIDVLGSAAAGNHIQFTTAYPGEAAYFNEIGADGSMPPAELGDVVAVSHTNIGPNKIDAFLQRRLAYDVTWDPASGRATGTITATFRNQAPAGAELPEYIVGNHEEDLPWGYNRSYVSVYSPWSVGEARIDGEPASVQSESELGRFAYSSYLDVPPGDEVTLELDVDGTWAMPAYGVTLSPAPLVNDEEVSVSLTIGGDVELAAAASSGDWEVDGRTYTLGGTLVEPQTLIVALPEMAGQLGGNDMVPHAVE